MRFGIYIYIRGCTSSRPLDGDTNGDEAVVGRGAGLGASWVGRGGAHKQKAGTFRKAGGDRDETKKEETE